MKRTKEIFIVTTCLLVWAVLLSGWTTLRTDTPAGSDDPREADDRMREIKAAFVERLDIDHYFEASATSTYDAADCGKHRYITFREPNSIVSVAENEAYLYTKDISGVAELHWIDENEAEFQITSGGTLNIVSTDLLGTLASDTYFTDANSVDLIKGDPNGDAVLPDGAELATSGAPTTDQAIANKKYVDDSVGALAFGTWTDKDSGGSVALAVDETYKAGSDGFVTVVATGTGNSYVNGYTDSVDASTKRCGSSGGWSGGGLGFTLPVKKNDYWKVTAGSCGTPTIYWLPIGSGTCVKQ